MIIDPTRRPGRSAETARPDARDSAARRRDEPLMHASIFADLPASEPAAPVPAGAVAPLVFLRLAVQGLRPVERQLLEGVVKVSQRRTPRLEILGNDQAREADVVMIDAGDAQAMAWARRHPWLARRAVIWIDGTEPAPGHMLVRRPVQWPILPMLLARALETGPRSAASSAAAVVPRGRLVAPSGQAPQILVVDDSLAVRAYLRSLLEQRGYGVTDADSVEVALQGLAGRKFDCVLMDVVMPGIDGFEGCRQIKARTRGAHSVPVVMLTSKGSAFDRIRGKMAGCDAYLTKPVDPRHLMEVLALQVRAVPVRRVNAAVESAEPTGHGPLAKHVGPTRPV
jgi:two-component system cell cycle response regulator